MRSSYGLRLSDLTSYGKLPATPPPAAADKDAEDDVETPATPAPSAALTFTEYPLSGEDTEEGEAEEGEDEEQEVALLDKAFDRGTDVEAEHSEDTSSHGRGDHSHAAQRRTARESVVTCDIGVEVRSMCGFQVVARGLDATLHAASDYTAMELRVAAMRKRLDEHVFPLLEKWFARASRDKDVRAACIISAHLAMLLQNANPDEVDSRAMTTYSHRTCS